MITYKDMAKECYKQCFDRLEKNIDKTIYSLINFKLSIESYSHLLSGEQKQYIEEFDKLFTIACRIFNKEIHRSLEV